MKHIKIQFGLSASLLSSLIALFYVSPWVSEQTGVDFTRLHAPIIALSAITILIFLLDFVVMSDTLDSELSATKKGRRELLWRLAGTRTVRNLGWPSWIRTVVVWLGYRGAFTFVLALTWYYLRSDQPLIFLVVIFGVPTLIANLQYLTARSTFELWAQAHPAVVAHVSNTPRVQDVLESEQNPTSR